MIPRFISTSRGRSFYEELRSGDSQVDLEGRAGAALDDENLNDEFLDYDVEQAEELGVRGDPLPIANRAAQSRRATPPRSARSKGAGAAGRLPLYDDADNDVPASLLVEPNEAGPSSEPAGQSQRQRSNQNQAGGHRHDRRQTGRPRRTQRPGDEGMAGLPHSLTARTQPQPPLGFMDDFMPGSAREKALWKWVNVSNLDNYMRDVYDYYQGYGLWSILLERFLHLVNVAFVAVFLTFLTQCVNYSSIPHSKTMSEILVSQCTKKMSGLWNLGLWIFVFYFIWKAIQNLLDLPRLLQVRAFYVHLLGIPEYDMQTISWQDVVARIMILRDANPRTASNLTPQQRHWIGSQSKERLDASDIANRLMRRENYLIAMINKDILRLNVPLPFLTHREMLSRTLEWTLMFSILDFVFDEQGQVNQEFLKADRRGELSEKLRSRFKFAGFMNLILAPFLTGYLVIVYFLTYFKEYQRNPSALGFRSYTPLAEWKFREFNELPHMFRKRLDMSYPYATHYVDQFPKVKTEQIARTVAFIAGSLATVLAIASLIDPELFLGFEVTRDRTVLFYLGIFTTVWAVARGNISEENTVFEPEFALRNVINYTHYEPDHWHDCLHSFDVKREFSELYKVKLMIFVEEVVSILLTPLILFVSLPSCSDQIVDFFREFTIHVDGLGYVCSFAEFDFKRGVGVSKKPSDGAMGGTTGGGAGAGAGADLRDDYYSTKHGKMAASYYGFLGHYHNYQKPGLPSGLPPGLRAQFHPPPAFPGLESPSLAAEMQGSRLGLRERARNSSRAPGSVPPRTTPRFGPAGPPPMSPMASILLDPHHQPNAASFGARSQHHGRFARGATGTLGDGDIIEESTEDVSGARAATAEQSAEGRRAVDDDLYESGGGLDQSTWQTSPTKTLSRENSGVGDDEPVAGVVGMIYQFNQAQLNRRPGGVL
jgi:autophagy-related protein 9